MPRLHRAGRFPPRKAFNVSMVALESCASDTGRMPIRILSRRKSAMT
jgi:hypothetical protein